MHKTLLSISILFLLLFSTVTVQAQTNITSLNQIITADGHYVITADIDASLFNASIASFSGILEANINASTHMPYRIKNLSVPLFTTLTGTVKNIVIEQATISQSGMVGAVACTANASARIYNVGLLGGTVGSTGASTANGSADCCGGLVGLLDGEARVVNCYSFANITGGNRVGGIVGYNNVSTTSSNLKTMVYSCMFYGDITAGNKISPIYNGNIITNRSESSGVSNFNYFYAGAPFMQDETQTPSYVYNCALMAEERFLNRFEFFRHLLNGHRETAGWWVDGTYSGSAMLKWVLLPDSIGTAHPFPILMQQGKYPSVVNIDAEHAVTGKPRNQGGKLGTLTVNIQMGSGGAVFGPSVGATITTSQLTLNITDKDTAHFNFNYYKVQLPYYNDVGTNNYRKGSDGVSRVVTGWKIVSITNGTEGNYCAGGDVTYDAAGNLTATPYNFADRYCTNKDLYSISKRVFNQGAYWDVPYGVTAITIEPYWAKAAYLADAYADVVYKKDMSASANVANVGGGQKYVNDNNYSINGENQKVFTSVGGARDNIGKHSGHTVYDYAIVLVGNAHNIGISSGDKAHFYTIMSADFDHDNEPDYSYVLRFNSRNTVHPVRVDFINIPGLGMAQKSHEGTGTYNFGIMQPLSWFESTNTSLFRETQFEYDNKSRDAAPYILQGGVMEQWVNGQSGGRANKTTYFHVGGNVYFLEFHRGTHQDYNYDANHSPVSVTGGDFDQFHLTGLYKASADITDDNAECYITGGRFRVMAGTGMDGIGINDGKGNITWIIDNADIKEFYAGSFNAANPARGNLHTIVNGGYIDFFCGGPKFGDMYNGKTVVTTASDCTFGTFFGAGYGGNSYSRQAPYNANNVMNIDWNEWIKGNIIFTGSGVSDNNTFTGYKRDYKTKFGGVSTQFNYQFIPMSGNADNCARLWIEFVNFSLATTRSVTSTLTGCTVLNNFYGGGSLGKVDGNVTSTLIGCTVKGNVFGAGYSASLPTVELDSLDGFRSIPFYYQQLGTYRPGVKGKTITYEWRQTPDNQRISAATNDAGKTARAIDQVNRILYTDENLSKTNLGSVSGAVTLTLRNTIVGTLIGEEGSQTLKPGTGNVYGGGDESTVSNATTPANATTTVNLEGTTNVRGNVFGGGNMGLVSGNTNVNIQNTPTAP